MWNKLRVIHTLWFGFIKFAGLTSKVYNLMMYFFVI